MTLSPSRSFRSLADSPVPRGNNGWMSSGLIVRTAFPACIALLFAASIYFYVRMTAQAGLDPYGSPTLDLSATSVSYVSQHWLLAQAKAAIAVDNKFHPEVSPQELLQVDPFSTHSGINVWDYYPPQLSCPDILRVGKTGEGGKWVCGVTHLSREEKCIMYSFGISTDVSFEVEILLRTSCVIHAFDPTVGRLPYHSLRQEILASLSPAQKSRIHFHKTAMGTRSGSSEVHSFNEQLYDIMHRLGHSFINLLKVDIEGGEWAVFNTMFADPSQHASKAQALTGAAQPSLPVGQLIIELHYSSMRETEEFFTGAERFGLLPFSREINLQPCIAGGRPVAVEYSFLHAENYFLPEKRNLAVPALYTPSWHVPIKAVIYFLTQRSRVERMAHALRQLHDNYWQDYPHYPVVIFHDDLRHTDEQRLQAAVPNMPLRFVPVTLALPDHLVGANVTIPERTLCSPGSSTLGYRHMCRFHATVVHKYLSTLGYAQYDYIMRLDDDSLITSPVGYDLFRYMRENKKQYGFVNMVADEPACVEGLWGKSAEFYNSSSVVAAARRNRGTRNRSSEGDDDDDLFRAWPRGAVFYNNFEISSFALWRSPVWLAYMDYIDRLGGIYTVRWGDAPLHTIGVTMVLERDEIHAFRDIAYRHDPFINQVPTGLPMPHMDPFLGPEVECRYYDKWMCFYSHGQYNASFNGTLNSTTSLSFNASHPLFKALDSVPPLQRIYYVNHTAPAVTQMTTVADTAVISGGTVLYTFAHGGREELLAATLRSWYEHYLAHFPATVVVFYNEQGEFNVNGVQSALVVVAELRSLVVFRAVTLRGSSAYTYNAGCEPGKEEVRGGSLFLRYDAMTALKSMGYSWMLRFGDDSSLHTRVPFNLFVHVHSNGALFAYQHAWETKSECASDLWDLTRSMCNHGAESRSRRLRKNAMRRHASGETARSGNGVHRGALECSGLFAQWAPLNVIVTSFSVSHISVWESPVCQKVLRATSAAHQSNETLPLWSDAAIHTMCVVTSLQPSQVLTLKDVDYRYDWTRIEAAPDPRNRLDRYQSKSLESYDRTFEVQKMGWLGGDVAASVVLPDPADLGSASQRVIWLFGDSIIGVSNGER
jgi:hypothetical protein